MRFPSGEIAGCRSHSASPAKAGAATTRNAAAASTERMESPRHFGGARTRKRERIVIPRHGRAVWNGERNIDERASRRLRDVAASHIVTRHK